MEMAAFPIVPPGLQELIPVSEFHIHQKWKGMLQSNRSYDFFGPYGNLVYRATQNLECCGPGIDFRVQDTQGYNVLQLLLPSECCGWEPKLQVIDASGQLLGYVEQNKIYSSESFNILDRFNQICLKVKGPGWGEGFMSDRVFPVLSADKSVKVGHITQVWKGMLKEMISREHRYVVQFPRDLEVSMKAILLSCVLLIDLLESIGM